MGLFGDDVTIVNQLVKPSRIDVHEHRAPTDESIRLLGIMESAAQKRILDAWRTGENGVQASCVVFAACATPDVDACWRVTLNGKTIEGKVRVTRAKFESQGKDVFRNAIIENIADVLAKNIAVMIVIEAERSMTL